MGKLTVNTIEDNGNNTIVTADGLGDVTLRANTIDAVTGTSSLTLGGTNATSITLGSGASFSNVSGQNYPAFEVYKSSDQSVTDGSTTKITFDTKALDTDSAYDTSTSKFTVPSGKAGKYFIYSILTHRSVTVGQINDCRTVIYKNGSQYKTSFFIFGSATGHYLSLNAYTILDLSDGDYVEIYGLVNVSSGNAQVEGVSTDRRSAFGGYRIGA